MSFRLKFNSEVSAGQIREWVNMSRQAQNGWAPRARDFIAIFMARKVREKQVSALSHLV